MIQQLSSCSLHNIQNVVIIITVVVNTIIKNSIDNFSNNNSTLKTGSAAKKPKTIQANSSKGTLVKGQRFGYGAAYCLVCLSSVLHAPVLKSNGACTVAVQYPPAFLPACNSADIKIKQTG